jgi:hypothetical protein
MEIMSKNACVADGKSETRKSIEGWISETSNKSMVTETKRIGWRIRK